MVLRPEPWGEALDALLDDAHESHRRRCPRRGSSSPVRPGCRSPRSWPASSPDCRGWSSPAVATRASTSGSTSMPRPGCRSRWSPGRLRAQRRRGRCPGHRRGGGPVGAGRHRQRRLARRGVPRGRVAGIPRLHQARDLARTRCAQPCCCPAITGRSPPGGTSSASPAPASGALTCSTTDREPTSRSVPMATALGRCRSGCRPDRRRRTPAARSRDPADL
jgi:hypothetical protein